jgi:hypothetical protein
MVEELDGTGMTDEPHDHVLNVEGKTYGILGEEVLPGRSTLPQDARPIGDGFVFYPRRRTNPKIPSYFLIPPIEFGELEESRHRLSISHVVSVSPSTLTDQVIRNSLGFPVDDAYATVLIGFNRI